MAFIIHKNPSHYNFSKSPVMVEIETDNHVASGDFGNKAKFIFYISANPTDQDKIQVTSAQISVTYRFTNGSAPLEWAVLLRGGAQTLSDYYDYVLTRLISNPGTASRYNVTHVGSGGFLFEAILPGAQDSNTTSNVIGLGFSFSNILNGTNNILSNIPRENYRIVIDIKQEKVATFPLNLAQFETIYSAQKEPYNGLVKFDISKIVDANLEYYFPIPNQQTAVQCLHVLKKFFVSIKEFYGSPSTEHVITITPTTGLQAGTNDTLPAFLLKAGLAPRYNKVLPTFQLDGYIWSYPLYLTAKPYNTYYIKKNQPEYLFFALPQDETANDIGLKIVATYEDGSTVTTIENTTNFGFLYRGRVFCFPVTQSGGTIHTAFNTPNKPIYFTVNITTVTPFATDISSQVIYYPVYEEMGEDRVFLFTNSMGGVDTLRTVGHYENVPEFERDVTTRQYYTDDASHLGMNANNQAYAQETFKTFSGWRTQEEIDWIEELFLAKYAVEVIDTLTYEPIVITSKKYRKHKTNEFLKGIEIEYYHQSKSPVTKRLAAGI